MLQNFCNLKLSFLFVSWYFCFYECDHSFHIEVLVIIRKDVQEFYCILYHLEGLK